MLIFILQMVVMISLGAILYIFARVLPRIDDTAIQEITSRVSFHKIVGYLEVMDEWFASLFQKFLRRVHVLILKLDNVVGEKLNRFKKNGTEKHTPFTLEKEEKKGEDKE